MTARHVARTEETAGEGDCVEMGEPISSIFLMQKMREMDVSQLVLLGKTKNGGVFHDFWRRTDVDCV